MRDIMNIGDCGINCLREKFLALHPWKSLRGGRQSLNGTMGWVPHPSHCCWVMRFRREGSWVVNDKVDIRRKRPAVW